MNKLMAVGAGAALSIIVAVAPVANAQVEVITAEQAADYRSRLPQAVEQTQPAALKTHLQGLQQPPSDDPTSDPHMAWVRQMANAVRVAEDLAALDTAPPAPFVHYSVPAMSPIMRAHDNFPTDGQIAGDVAIIAARDEYEPGSFVLYGFADLDSVQLSVPELKTDDGAVFPADNLDLKVVKSWYQVGNAWYSYFSDVDVVLVPELLLNDENLIRVDTEEKANYARVNGPDGEQHVWISAPHKIDSRFDAYTPGFADAQDLQPVTLAAGEFKQFFLTAHVQSDAAPGLYRGQITVAAEGHPAAQVPVVLKVLPFELPLPMANFDVDRSFVVTLMGAWPRIDADHPAFMPTLKNLRQHNLLHLGPEVGPSDPPKKIEQHVNAMKEAGFLTDFIIGGGVSWRGTHDGTPYTFDDLMGFRRDASAWRDFYLEHFGHTNATTGLGDEQGASWVTKARQAWRIIDEFGLMSNLAGHGHYFNKAGYMLDMTPTAGAPQDAEKVVPWREVGNAYVSFYANQHNGAENPAFVRRQHGLLGYLSNFDMVNNYEFAYGPWNDRGTMLYKPMVLAYPTSEGLVDTLAWEGFREGIDDIRYATKLRQLANEAIQSGDLDRIYEGRKVRQWFALMDGMSVDLNAVRMEMIEKILHLTDVADSN